MVYWSPDSVVMTPSWPAFSSRKAWPASSSRAASASIAVCTMSLKACIASSISCSPSAGSIPPSASVIPCVSASMSTCSETWASDRPMS